MDDKPSYMECIAVLKKAPPREMISDQRYWDWRNLVDAILDRHEASRPREVANPSPITTT